MKLIALRKKRRFEAAILKREGSDWCSFVRFRVISWIVPLFNRGNAIHEITQNLTNDQHESAFIWAERN